MSPEVPMLSSVLTPAATMLDRLAASGQRLDNFFCLVLSSSQTGSGEVRCKRAALISLPWNPKPVLGGGCEGGTGTVREGPHCHRNHRWALVGLRGIEYGVACARKWTQQGMRPHYRRMCWFLTHGNQAPVLGLGGNSSRS